MLQMIYNIAKEEQQVKKTLSILLVTIMLLTAIVSCQKENSISNEAPNGSEQNQTTLESNVDLTKDDEQDTTKIESPSTSDPLLGPELYSIAELKSYLDNPEDWHRKEENDYCINPKFERSIYVDMSSIIPDEEIFLILLYESKYYSVNYGTSYNDNNDGVSVSFKYSEEKQIAVDWINSFIKNGNLSETPTKTLAGYNKESFNERNLWLQLGEYNILYMYRNDTFKKFVVDIGDYFVKISIYAPETDAQKAFVEALNPDYGATDDTVIAMLDKIKALIPTDK